MISSARSSKPKTYFFTVITQNLRIQQGLDDLDNFCKCVSIDSVYCMSG